MPEEIRSITISWNDIYNPEKSYNLLKELKWSTICNTNIDQENRETIIDIIYDTSNYSNSQKSFEIIPNEVIYKDKCLIYKISKKISILNHSDALNFILNNCSYIKDWIEACPEQTSFDIFYDITTSGSNSLGTIVDKLADLNYFKSVIKNPLNLEILALAGTIKKFYQQTDEPFDIHDVRKLTKIDIFKDTIIDVMRNPKDKLENYNMEKTSDVIIYSHSSGFRGIVFNTFNFLDNTILETPYFEMYSQNLDLKFLSSITLSLTKSNF